MTRKTTTPSFFTCLIATVWIINGLFCKLLNLVPRHQLIVSRILGDAHSGLFTKLIGLAELVMATWILSNIKSRLCTITQIAVVAAMNSIEFFIAPDLLLFGKVNAIVALIFIAAVYYNDFELKRKLAKQI